MKIDEQQSLVEFDVDLVRQVFVLIWELVYIFQFLFTKLVSILLNHLFNLNI